MQVLSDFPKARLGLIALRDEAFYGALLGCRREASVLRAGGPLAPYEYGERN